MNISLKKTVESSRSIAQHYWDTGAIMGHIRRSLLEVTHEKAVCCFWLRNKKPAVILHSDIYIQTRQPVISQGPLYKQIMSFQAHVNKATWAYDISFRIEKDKNYFRIIKTIWLSISIVMNWCSRSRKLMFEKEKKTKEKKLYGDLSWSYVENTGDQHRPP